MKRSVLFLGCGTAIAVVLLGVAGASDGSGDALSEIQKLRNEVVALRERVGALEKQVEEQSAAALHRGVWPQGQAPKHWQRFEFNNMPCYIVPLGNGAAPTHMDAEPTGPGATQKPSR